MADYDGKIRIRSELDNKSFNSQIVETERKLKAQKKTYDAIENRSGSYDGKTESLRKYAVEIEKTTNKLAKLREQQLKVSLGNVSNIQYNENSNFAKGLSLNTGSIGTSAKGIQPENFDFVADNVKDLKNAFPEVADEAEKASKRTSSSFGNAGKELKRFGLTLFGVRTIFSVVSKASNAYLSQHTETAQKMSAIWTALGNLIGPIIERVADGILKIVGYLNVFVKALTNGKIDLTKGMNANTKSIKGASSAMKELNNQMYSFDEMNVEQDNSSSGIGSGGINSDLDFKMPELNPEIVKFLTDMGNKLRENKDLVFALGGILGGVFGAAKIGGWLSNLGKLFGGGTGTEAKGLLGLTNVLNGLLAFELITIAISILYYGKELSELKKINEEVSKMNDKNTKDAKKINDSNLQTAKSYEKGSKEIEKYIESLKQQVESSKDTIEAKQKEKDSITGLNQVWDIFGGTSEKATKIQKSQLETIINVAKNMQELALEGKLTDEQMNVYNETMKYLNNTYHDLDESIFHNADYILKFGKNVDGTTQKIYDEIQALRNTDIEAKLSTGNQKTYFKSLWDTTKNTFNDINNLKATPIVEVKANTKKLTSVFDALIKTPTLSASDVSSLSWVNNALKRIGLAHGAILNAPGRGVPVGYNFISGEAGREAYMPLDDPSAMAQLGYEIGKNVSVELTNNNYMNNRLISRETRRVSNQMGYLTNGRVM